MLVVNNDQNTLAYVALKEKMMVIEEQNSLYLGRHIKIYKDWQNASTYAIFVHMQP